MATYDFPNAQTLSVRFDVSLPLSAEVEPTSGHRCNQTVTKSIVNIIIRHDCVGYFGQHRMFGTPVGNTKPAK